MSISVGDLLGRNQPPPPPVHRPPTTPEVAVNTICQLFGNQEHDWELTAVVSRRGTRMVTATCRRCDTYTTYIKHADLPRLFGVIVDDVPVRGDNRCTSCSGSGCSDCTTQCVRCRQWKNTDRHHIAPQALFEDADLWPIVDLCRDCHSYWHSIVTPNLRNNPHPPPPHLRDEWARYKAPRPNESHAWWECGCTTCVADRQFREAFRAKYWPDSAERWGVAS